jgi:signal transduction histidine kinase/CheY-like chemotaxis protein
MKPADDILFDGALWRPALEKFAAVTHLTVNVYGAGGHVVCGPVHATPLFAALTARGYDPGIFTECARQCLAQTTERPAVIVAPTYGLAVVGTSLVLEEEIVGAAVAGYALADFSQRANIERLARDAHAPFPEIWDVARTQQPVPERRLLINGELLQVLVDTILRENYRTRQADAAAVALTAAAAAKDEFLAILSHELRTPLTPILGWARMLKLGDTSKIARAAEVIERNALLQLRLVEDLLELTRVTWGKVTLDLRTTDLGEALFAAREAFVQPARQKGLTLHVARPERPLFVSADATRLQQILRNVLSNALKFTPAGGRVTVTLAEAAGLAVVTIQDTGEGIEPEFLPFVFELFQQQEHGTRRTHEGLGIGLALVKRLTELLGGAVSIASDGAGHGTAVTMQFPLVERPVQEVPAAPAVVSLVHELQGVRVLILEDMDDAREATRVILEQLGASVLEASDGLEALDVIKRDRPDVVLCDLRMPNMDGFDFIRTLRLQSNDDCPPIIAMSALVSTADHLRTQEAGFEGHLDKPFNDAGLRAAVGVALARRFRT